MGNINQTEEVVVTCKNEPGALAKCTLPLKQNGVNIECFVGYPDAGGKAAFHFITNNNTKAKELWKNGGWEVKTTPVVCCTLGNTPGTLFTAASTLAENKIDINYCYYSNTQGGNNTTVVFCTNNNTKAAEFLGKCTTGGGGCCG